MQKIRLRKGKFINLKHDVFTMHPIAENVYSDLTTSSRTILALASPSAFQKDLHTISFTMSVLSVENPFGLVRYFCRCLYFPI
jgi:hypothetical protein